MSRDEWTVGSHGSYRDASRMAHRLFDRVLDGCACEGVVRIVKVDGPGEREKVDTFMERHGLARDRCAWGSCSQVVPIILAGLRSVI